MKKVIILMIAAALVLSSAPAFAAKGKGPGDGGFFTKFFNGALGESWKKGTSDKTAPQPVEQVAKPAGK